MPLMPSSRNRLEQMESVMQKTYYDDVVDPL